MDNDSTYKAERRSRQHYEGRARWYDWANRFAALVRGTSLVQERRHAVERLELRRGQRVLEISVGTGTNLPLLSEAMGSGEIVGLDISRAMLLQCRRKMAALGIPAQLVESDAGHVPFRSESFDAVFHHGGIAEFGDRAHAIAEMVRVAKADARIVICDVGVPRNRKLSFVNRLLLRAQPEYAKHPPDDIMPADVADVRLSWFGGGTWYLIECMKGQATPLRE